MSNILYAHDLYHLTRQAVAFANHDRVTSKTQPGATYALVHLESDGHQVISVATDGAVMGASRREFITEVTDPIDIPTSTALNMSNQPSTPFQANISIKDARETMRIAKTAKGKRQTRTVVVHQIENTYLQMYFSSGEEQIIPLDQQQYPNWRNVFPAGSTGGTPRAVTHFNPAQLAKFAQVDTDEEHVRMVLVSQDDAHDRRQRSALVTIGTNFIGAIMPFRYEYMPGVTPQWDIPQWL